MPTDRIMVVEDEEDILDIVMAHLDANGFSADRFSSPVIAFDRFSADPSRYALVLTDIRMPEMTGLELAHRLRKIKPEIKIVLMTSFEHTDEITASLQVVGYSELIRKPFELVEICRAVRKQLAIP